MGNDISYEKIVTREDDRIEGLIQKETEIFLNDNTKGEYMLKSVTTDFNKHKLRLTIITYQCLYYNDGKLEQDFKAISYSEKNVFEDLIKHLMELFDSISDVEINEIVLIQPDVRKYTYCYKQEYLALALARI